MLTSTIAPLKVSTLEQKDGKFEAISYVLMDHFHYHFNSNRPSDNVILLHKINGEKILYLKHKFLHDAMKGGAFVAIALLSSSYNANTSVDSCNWRVEAYISTKTRAPNLPSAAKF